MKPTTVDDQDNNTVGDDETFDASFVVFPSESHLFKKDLSHTIKC